MPAPRKQHGFTIIEVLIVLAIVGLILLIVFFAVPALKRSSRNLKRRNDLGRFYSLLQEKQNATPGGRAPYPATTNPSGDHTAYNDFVDNLDTGFDDYSFPWKPSGTANHAFNMQQDQIVYFALHHCNNGEEAASHIVSGSHDDYIFSVIIGLEPNGKFYCIDNDE